MRSLKTAPGRAMAGLLVPAEQVNNGRKGQGSEVYCVKLRAWSRCLSRRMKLEGKEKANVSAKALQVSLAYQFVTPLTSMTVRAWRIDGLEPIIDKPLDGMGWLRTVGMGKLLRTKSPQGVNSLSAPPLSRFSALG